MRLFLLFIFCHVCVVANAKHPDGAWNGKLWNKKELEKGVTEGDVNALAEWAYCSSESILEIPYDEKLIMERLLKASAGGSALADFKLSRCYIYQVGCEYDLEKSHQYLERSQEADHSMALSTYADLYFRSHVAKYPVEGVKPSARWGNILLDKVKERECSVYLIANSRLALCKEDTEKDMVFAMESMLRAHESCHSLFAAYMLYENYYRLKKESPARSVVTEKVMLDARRRLERAAELGNPRAKYYLAYNGVYFENPHRAVPLMMEALDSGFPYAVSAASDWMYAGCRSKKEESAAVAGLCLSSYELAAMSYDLGVRNLNINFRATYHLMSPYEKKIPTKDCMQVVDILRENLRINIDHLNSHIALSDFYYKAANEDGAKAGWAEKSLAHVLYMSHTSRGAHWLASRHLQKKNRSPEDLVRGVAAVKWALTINSGSFKKYEEGWLKSAEIELNEAQRVEVQELVKQGYPAADRFRRKALKDLKNYGDVSEDVEFKSAKQRNWRNSVIDKQSDFPREMRRRGVLALAYVNDQMEDPDYVKSLFEKYLAKEKLVSDQEKHDLVRILVEDDARLEQLLDSRKEGKYAERVKQCHETIKAESEVDRGGNALGAVLGWYLTYEKGMTAMPLISSFEEGSLASKCGLWEADAVYNIQGVSMKSRRARNLFKRFVELWPSECEVDMLVGRSRWGNRDLYNSSPKDKMVHVKFKKPQ